MIPLNHANGFGDLAGPIVPIDTEKLLIEKQQCQADLPAQVASTSSMPPINRDGTTTNWIYHFLVSEFYITKCYYVFAVNHENGVVNVAGATGELLARKRKNQVEVPSQDACNGFMAPISRVNKFTDWIQLFRCRLILFIHFTI